MSLLLDLLPVPPTDERSGVPWSRSRSFCARVLSPQRFDFHQGSRWGFVAACLMLGFAGVWLGLSHEVELKPVEGRQRVRMVERSLAFGFPWKTADHGEVTVLRLVTPIKSGSYLELRGPGWSRHLAGAWLSTVDLQRIEQAAAPFLKGEGAAQVLRFPAPRWLSLGLAVLTLPFLVVTRLARTHVDGVRREVLLSDWAGLRRELIPAARVMRVSVEDGDPSGWRARSYLPERWLIVAHLQPGGTRLLASTADRELAARWASRVSLLLHQGRLTGVGPGSYRLWDRESPL